MSIFKNAKVGMLTTNEKANITLTAEENLNLSVPMKKGDINVKQHLYIITDDEILPNDYYINTINNIVSQASKNHKNSNGIVGSKLKKIIATTDKSLQIIKENYPKKSQRTIINLPQPSPEFINKYIDEYNKGNIIIDVLVEYWNGVYENEYDTSIKLDKNGFITIKKKEVKLYSEQKVYEIASNAYILGLSNSHIVGHSEENFDVYLTKFKDWIKTIL